MAEAAKRLRAIAWKRVTSRGDVRIPSGTDSPHSSFRSATHAFECFESMCSGVVHPSCSTRIVPGEWSTGRADADGFVGLWDLETLAAAGELEAKPSIYALAVVGPVLFAARGDGEAVVAWDMPTKARADAPPYAAESLLAVGKKLYLGRDDGSISVWDAARATPRRKPAAPPGPQLHPFG